MYKFHCTCECAHVWERRKRLGRRLCTYTHVSTAHNTRVRSHACRYKKVCGAVSCRTETKPYSYVEVSSIARSGGCMHVYPWTSSTHYTSSCACELVEQNGAISRFLHVYVSVQGGALKSSEEATGAVTKALSNHCSPEQPRMERAQTGPKKRIAQPPP